jgi:hypothetical protein
VGQPIHTQILTAAAREILRPLGLRQRGRSRLWYADQGWWLIVVEFQPHSRDEGSFLNVAAMWLWREQDYESFDYTYPDSSVRHGTFTRFESESQFTPLAKDLARQAAGEVEHYRSLFPSVHSVARHLAQKSPKQIWDNYHAGIACALAGNVIDACRFFEEVASNDHPVEWAQSLAAIAREYISAVGDLPAFRSRIKEVVLRTRELLKLGIGPTIEFGEDSR